MAQTVAGQRRKIKVLLGVSLTCLVIGYLVWQATGAGSPGSTFRWLPRDQWGWSTQIYSLQVIDEPGQPALPVSRIRRFGVFEVTQRLTP
jgi:hypothetical protein